MVLIAYLTLCMLGIFMILLSSLYFFKINFLKKISFRNTIRVSNCLDPDHGPNLGRNCLQRLSATTKVAACTKRVKHACAMATRLVFDHMCRYQFSGATLCYVGLCYATACATLRCYIINIEQSRKANMKTNFFES